jgi:hypothetical protein
MTDNPRDVAEELLNVLNTPDFTSLPKAEQLARGKSLLRRLEATIEERRKGTADAVPPEQWRRSTLPDLPKLIGEVVIAAAWAEDAAGTLIQASSGDWEVRAKGYDDSSSSLVKALKRMAAVPDELVARLESALEHRHFVVHGFFVDGNFYKHPETGKTYDFVSMKRSWRTDAPERDVRAFTRNALEWLGQEFWDIEAELEDLHTKALFDQSDENTVIDH